MTTYQTTHKQPIRLANEIAKGGEGAIYSVQGSNVVVAKIYHDNRLGQGNYLEAKLQAMMANPPQDQAIVWPTDLLYDGGKFAGYLMPRLQQTIDLFELYNPQQRQAKYPGTDWRYLHIVARNLAAAFLALHQAGYVMGDVNQKNVLVEPSGTIRLVDTDSFQVRDGNGRVFRCSVGVPEYTPREMRHHKDLSKVDRNINQDAFGLGVLIFQLLMEGFHPFTGAPKNPAFSVQQPVMEYCIEQGVFPYDSKSRNQYAPPPNAPNFGSLHSEVQKLFIKCFVAGHSNPVSRPNATEWHKALAVAINDLKQCATDKTHWYFPSNGNCPWCAKHTARTQPISPQPTYVPPISPIPQPYQPPAASPAPRQAKGSSNRAALWMAILLVLLGSAYTVLNTISFETPSSIDTSSMGRLTDPTPIANSVRPTRYIEPTNIPRVTPVRATNANSPVPNLLNLGNGQCPAPNLSSQLSPSQIAVANDVLRLRSEPDTNAEILNRVGTGELVTLIQGPVCSQNWLWWQVQTSNNQIGWVVEIGRGGEIRGGGIYLLLPEGSELGPEVNRAD